MDRRRFYDFPYMIEAKNSDGTWRLVLGSELRTPAMAAWEAACEAHSESPLIYREGMRVVKEYEPQWARDKRLAAD